MTLKIKIKDSSNLQYYPTLSLLPIRVAQDEGLFKEEGLDVEYIHQDKDWRARPEGEAVVEQVDTFSRHYLFEQSPSDVVMACEWGNLRRAYDSKRGGKALSRVELPDNQAIIAAPDTKFTHPRFLANQPVAVRFHSGSHYSALELLEGFIPRDQIKLVNYDHLAGWNAVLSGEIAAVTLMEPWITLARKKGLQVLAETATSGIELGAPSVNPEAYEAYVRALRKAGDRITADKRKYFGRYLDFILQSLPEEFREDLTLEDFYLPKFRFGGPRPYPKEDFQRTYDWMVKWDLIKDDASYDRLVDKQLALV